MAIVYRARHRTLNREVALKVLDPVHAGPMAARFDREARNAAKLSHPGCVRVFDYGAAVDGSRFIAMDLLDGPTLREEMDTRGKFSIGRAVWVAGELLRALGHAHENGVLHRDIKPENVMFSARNDVVLIDFGLSRLEDDAALTAVGTCIGSPSYLSPERLLGQDYDERADIYAVGVVLYELIAGRRPVEGDGALEIALRQIEEEPEPIVWLRPEAPLELGAVIHRALAKDPRDRFASAGEMLGALEVAMRRAAEVAPARPEPAEEARAVARSGVAEEAPTEFMMTPVVRISILRRVWAWLRFGRWRWRGRPPGEPARDRAADSLVGL
jgi:serine/threonine-protein kinase